LVAVPGTPPARKRCGASPFNRQALRLELDVGALRANGAWGLPGTANASRSQCQATSIQRESIMVTPTEGGAAIATGLTVADLMTTALVTVNGNDTLTTADDIMKLGRIRHLPVVDDDGALVGVVSQRDLFHSALLRALGYGSHATKKALETLAIKDAMHDATTTSPTTSLRDAARVMCERKIGCLPVLDDGKLVGILTEGDFARLVAGDKTLPEAAGSA
jgi:CBS domain-containing membrane protein